MRRIVLLAGALIALLVGGLVLGEGRWKSDGVVICDGTRAGPVTIAPDGRGGAIIAWSDSRGSHYTESVYAQRVDSTGQVLWQENGVCLRPDTHLPDKLVAVSDGRGGAIVVWEDCRSFSLPLQVRAQRVDSSGTVCWGSEGKVVTSDTCAWEYYLQVVTDGEKGAILAWVIYCYYGDSSSTSLYAQRVDSLGTLKWGYSGVFIDSDVDDYFPGIASDGHTGAIVSWSDRYGSGNQNYVCCVNEGGKILWDITLCNEQGWRTPGSIVGDGKGGGIITWTDGRISKWDIYAQRVDSAGYVMWETNGIPVCLVDSVQNKPRGVPTGGGGEIAVWKDYRNGRQDLYAQRIDGDGRSQWDTNGVFVVTAIDTTEQMYTIFEVLSDNRSGAIIAWMDYRAGNWDIYCQRVDSSGTLQWGKDGLGVCTDRDWEGYPIMVPDGAGGAIIAWDHAPAGKAGVKANVCAQRVDSSGNLRWGGIRDEYWGDMLPREVSLGQNYPNPFNPTTVISYQVSGVSPHRTTLRVYNILGEEVRTLVDKKQAPGNYSVRWNGKDGLGREVSSGIYLYRLRVGGFSRTKKMLLLR